MATISEILLRSKADVTGFAKTIASSQLLRNELNQARRSTSELGDQLEKTLSGFNRAVLGIRTGLLQTAGGFILGSLIQDATRSVIGFGKSFIDVNSQVQQFKLQFTNLFKSIGLSAEEAGLQTERAFNFAKEVAKETPFDLPDITQAILRLQTFGLSVERFLQRSIDLASALGKPLEEVTQAFTNLQSRRFGESFEQFARLGIARDLLEAKGLVFDRNGSYRGSVEQAMQAVTEIIDERFAGFAESQQGTFKQLQSNLGDIIFQFKEAFGAPIFAGINADLKDFVGTLSDNQGTLESFGVAFGELFEGARSSASDAFKGIISDLNDGQAATTEDFFEFGVNLFVAFANGILEGGKFVLKASTFVAQGIATFFESFSPPKAGPLKEIDVWGANLINTFFEGMQNADFGLLQDVLDQVKSAFDSAVGAGFIDTETPAQDFLGLVDIIVNGLDEIEAGGDGAHQVFETLSETIGQAAFEIEAFIASAQRIKALTADLEAAQSALDDIKDANDERLDGLSDELDKLKDADDKRRDAFDAERDAANAAADAGRAAADAGRRARQEENRRQRELIQDQIDVLNDSKQAIDDSKDAALEALEAQKDAALAPLEAATDALDEQVKQARRALEDFSFQTEGIPERFTRQRRRELERILTLREREAEDARDAFNQQKKQIEDFYKAQRKAIEENAKAQKKALDDQIEALRDQLDAIRDIEEAENGVNSARDNRKFIPDPRIKELEDIIKKEKERAKEEEDAAAEKIKDIRDVLDEEKKRHDALKEQIDARLQLERAIKEALEEQLRIQKEQADGNLLPTQREISTFGEEFDKNVNSKIEEARQKLKDLIPQETRDKFKRDFQFFADFFKGIADIKGPNFDESNPSEGFTLGENLRLAIQRIGTAFQEDVLPKVELFVDGLKTAFGIVGQILDGIDQIKSILAAGFKFVGLDTVANILNTPIRDVGLTLGAYLLAIKAIPGGDIVFRFSTRFIVGTIPAIFKFILGALGIGGAGAAAGGGGAAAGGTAGGAAAAGAGGAGLAAAAVPILIAIAVIASIALIFAFATDFKGIRTATLDFLRKNPDIAALLAGAVFPVAIPLAIPLSIFFFLKNRTGAFETIGDFIQDGIIGPIKGAAGAIGSAASELGGAISSGFNTTISTIGNLIGGVATGAKDITIGAFNAITTFLGPWLKAIESVMEVYHNTVTLPFKIIADFIETIFIPLFVGPLTTAFRGLTSLGKEIFSTLFSPIQDAFENLVEFVDKSVLPFFTQTLPSIFQNAATSTGGAFITIFEGISSTIIGIITAISEPIFNAITGLFGRPIQWIIENVIPFFTETLPGLFIGLAEALAGIATPLIEALTGPFMAAMSILGGFVTFFQSTLPNAITSIATKINNFLTSEALTNPFSTAKEFLQSNIIPFVQNTLPNAFNGLPAKMEGFLSGLGRILTAPFETFSRLMTDSIGPLLTERIPGFFRTFNDSSVTPIASFVRTLIDKFGEIAREVAGLPAKLSNPFIGIYNTFFNFGSNIIKGLIDGLTSQFQNLLDTFTDFLGKIPAGAKKLFGIDSPSKLMRQYGNDIMEGLELGIADGQDPLKNVVDKTFQTLSTGIGAEVNSSIIGQLSAEQVAGFDQFSEQGAMAGKVFAEGFSSEVQKALAANPATNAFLKVNMNEINVTVDNKKTVQNLQAKSSAQAAKIVTSIIVQGGSNG